MDSKGFRFRLALTKKAVAQAAALQEQIYPERMIPNGLLQVKGNSRAGQLPIAAYGAPARKDVCSDTLGKVKLCVYTDWQPVVLVLGLSY